MDADQRIEALIARLDQLAQYGDDCEIAWAGASTEQAIATVERALDANLSGSFRRFILRTGGGGIDTLSISAIPAADPLGGLGTVYGDTLHYRQAFWASPLPPHLIVVQRSQDDNEPFCLDSSRVIDGENPVVLYYQHSSRGHAELIAPSFLDFLDAYLAPYFSDLDTHNAS